MTELMEGQMSLFAQDSWCGKTFQEPCPQTTEKTSGQSLKKRQGSSVKTPLFLDLRKDRNGLLPDASWEMGGPLPGEFTMRSFGEFPKEENASLLSQILQDDAPLKYCLSAKACRGILNRANRRGKQLPDILQKALEAQADGEDGIQT